MRLVRCPCGCGHVFDADDARVCVAELSPAAVALLQYAPTHFRRGKPASVRLLGDLSGYSKSRAWQVLHELERAGYVARVPFGRQGTRSQFVGVPTMILAAGSLMRAA